ncbi:MAG: hypothetical protein Kow00103_08730 [Candidatus Caldatribacteriota bacterium]
MKNWESLLKTPSISWLLEEDNPSVRYFTLLDLLGKEKIDSEVIQTKKLIALKGIVPKILSKQKEGGYWEEEDRFYTNKYKGTVWQLLILAEMGAHKNLDIRIEKAAEFILNHSQDRLRYGFSVYPSTRFGGGRPSSVIPCLTGNMVYSLIRLGFFHDERVQKAIQWITTYQRFDDGVKRFSKDWPYDQSGLSCWGKHSCHMGVVKALKALAEIPDAQRNKEVKRTIEMAVEYLLQHHIYKRSHNLDKIAKPGWLRLGFPLMYQDDVLEILEILTRLGCYDERMQDAINILISKQNEHGKWILENTFNVRFHINIEKKGEPSKWITLNALRVLKRYYHLPVLKAG